ncbi:MAG TPA: PAS domain S-box protein [Burkholderiaceae bacterium]|nr:PAS domain S-box protein [Burkholderiaceae bacterium]
MAEPSITASEPPSRSTLLAILATLPVAAALGDESLQWLTLNEPGRRALSDGGTATALQRLRAAGLAQCLASRSFESPFLTDLRDPTSGEPADPRRRARLRIAPVACADAGPLFWIFIEPLAANEEERRNPIADRDAYRLLFDEAVVPMTIQNAGFEFIDANAAFCHYSGYSRDQLIGADPLKLFTMSERSHSEAWDARTRMDWSGRVPFQVEDRKTLRPDGTERRYNSVGRLAFGSSGEPVVVNTAIDITDLKLAQESLEQQLHWFETMLTTTSAGVAVLDLKRFVRVNRQFERLTGWTGQELQGASPALLFGGHENWEALRDRIDRASGGSAPFVEELTLTRRDGQTRQCEVHVGWIAGQVGRQAILTLHDISRLKQVENQRLEEVRSQRDLVIREVHHRIKNNLQGVAGLLQQVAVRKPEAAGALSEVANQIASIAQVYGLKVREQERLAFSDLLEAVLGSLGRTTGADIGLRIAPEAMGRRGWLNETDAVPIALVLNEIATNAIKHRDPDGALQASLDLEDEAFCVRISNPGRLAEGAAMARVDASVFGLGLIKAMLPRRGASFDLSEKEGRVTARLLLRPPALDLGPV